MIGWRLKHLIIVFIICSTMVYSSELRIIDYKKGAEYGQQFGDACEGVGDVNGDGYGDFLVTEFRDRKLHLYLGGPSPFDSPPAVTWDNHGTPSQLESFSPVCVGDVDCDGVNDFISVFSQNDTVKLFLGLENLDPDDSKTIFIDTSYSWSYRISGGGDNNNDGNPDFWLFPERPL
ncbi:MAG: hypothetical protein GY841_19970, partial [FCB group bacterium]|nr:hypothetical protein [FCB group bacterium]